MTGNTVRNIVIVEDEEPLARMMQWQLESHGFSVMRHGNGTEAIRYAAEQRPDLVVLDLMLPDIHGYDVCRRLQKIYHPWSVPILMLTAMDRPIDQLRGFAHGAFAYLTKPYEEEELIRTISLLLSEPVSSSSES